MGERATSRNADSCRMRGHRDDRVTRHRVQTTQDIPGEYRCFLRRDMGTRSVRWWDVERYCLWRPALLYGAYAGLASYKRSWCASSQASDLYFKQGTESRWVGTGPAATSESRNIHCELAEIMPAKCPSLEWKGCHKLRPVIPH
jgi:hypothetical protein